MTNEQVAAMMAVLKKAQWRLEANKFYGSDSAQALHADIVETLVYAEMEHSCRHTEGGHLTEPCDACAYEHSRTGTQ